MKDDVVGGTCGTHGRGVYRVLVRRPEGKRPLGRRMSKWEINIKIDFMEIGICGANWISNNVLHHGVSIFGSN
jgi:hypothetical protein